MMKSILIFMTLAVLSACGTKQPKVEDETQKNPQSSIAHLNLKTGCADCHLDERPAPAEEAKIVLHGEAQPCEKCHTWPAFKVINKEIGLHNPYPTSCLGCHNRAQEMSTHVAFGDCVTCHAFPNWLPPIAGTLKITTPISSPRFP